MDFSKEPSTENQEQQIWRDNVGLLYEFLMVHNLEWPALSLDWVPTSRRYDDDQISQRLVLGTHALEKADNYLYVLEMLIPDPIMIEPENRKYAIHTDYAGYEFAQSNLQKKFFCRKVIAHPLGEIHRVRVNPGNEDVAVAISVNGALHLVDIAVSDSLSDLPVEPQCRRGSLGTTKNLLSDTGLSASLVADTCDGWAAEWSKLNPNVLASSSDSGCVHVWNIDQLDRFTKSSGSKQTLPSISPTTSYKYGHNAAAVLDVQWHREIPQLLFSSGDDGALVMRDIRLKDTERSFVRIGLVSGSSIASISTNTQLSWLIATGGSDSEVSLWDMRRPMSGLHKMCGHRQAINFVQFNPQNPYLLLSSAEDRRVIVWDLRSIGKEQTLEEADDGPPEMIFNHGGHSNNVGCAQWNPSSELMIASCSDSNELHIWQIDHLAFMRSQSDCDSTTDSNDENFDTIPVE